MAGEIPFPVTLVLKSIQELVCCSPSGERVIFDGCVLVSGDGIVYAGPTSGVPTYKKSKDCVEVDCSSFVVTPGFVDSHTHAVFAGDRSSEFEERLTGADYGQQLLSSTKKKPKGIHFTVDAVRKASEDELYALARKRLQLMLRNGTTTVEIKSGYGLDWNTEEKMLRVIERLKQDHMLDISSTFLCHTFPVEYRRKRATYVKKLKEMIRLVGQKRLATSVDVFCDPLGFSLKETEALLRCAKENGLLRKVHWGQTARLGSTQLAVDYHCLSADHLNYVTKKDIQLLSKNGVVCTVLPGVAHHLREKKLPPVKQMLECRAIVAMATDYNPGSSPCYSMKQIMELGARQYGIDAYTALAMSTINGATALAIDSLVGKLEMGKQADILVWDVPNHKHLTYEFGNNSLAAVIKRGKVVEGSLKIELKEGNKKKVKKILIRK